MLPIITSSYCIVTLLDLDQHTLYLYIYLYLFQYIFLLQIHSLVPLSVNLNNSNLYFTYIIKAKYEFLAIANTVHAIHYWNSAHIFHPLYYWLEIVRVWNRNYSNNIRLLLMMFD